MSLRAPTIARGLAQLFPADSRALAASALFLGTAGPPARGRCGRAWRASLVAGGPPRRIAADERPLLSALAALPGTSLPPISNNNGRGRIGSRHQPSGATRALLASASAAFLTMMGCEDGRERKALCIPKKGGNMSRGKSVKARKKSFAPKHDLKSIAAKHGAKGGSRSKTDSLSWQAPVIDPNDPSDRAFDMVSHVLI